MKLPARGSSLPLRCLILLLLCACGVVFATESTWKTALTRVGQMRMTDWFGLTADVDPRPAAALPVPEEQFAMNRWLDRLLFSAPASSWMPDSTQTAPSPVLRTRSSAEPLQLNAGTTPNAFFSARFLAELPPIGPNPTAPTATGTWSANASGNWGNAGNWSGGVVADGAGNTANFNAVDLTTDITVTLDSSRTIGFLNIGDTNGTHRYSIAPSGGANLTFDSGAPFTHSILQQSSTSAGDTISASILLKNDLDINNLSATNELHLSGNITSAAASSSNQLIWFNNATGAAGDIRVSGIIGNGTTGATLSLVVVNGGTVTLTGNNTYTGFTEVDGGTLLINGDNSAATGGVYVYNGGTLGGHGKVGGDVFTSGGRITGETDTTVGTLTLLGSLNMASGEGPGGGTYVANLSSNTSDLLAITRSLTLGFGTTLDIEGTADGVTTYILATFASRSGTFQFENDIPANYTLVYHDTDIELVPIPEPATWLGGGVALAAIAWMSRRKLRRRLAA